MTFLQHQRFQGDASVAACGDCPAVPSRSYLAMTFSDSPESLFFLQRTVSSSGMLCSSTVSCGVITPIALMMRLFGRDKLERRFDADASSYWIAHPKQESTARYFRQS